MDDRVDEAIPTATSRPRGGTGEDQATDTSTTGSAGEPDGTDLDRHGTVVIWCDRFDSAFGAADLN